LNAVTVSFGPTVKIISPNVQIPAVTFHSVRLGAYSTTSWSVDGMNPVTISHHPLLGPHADHAHQAGGQPAVQERGQCVDADPNGRSLSSAPRSDTPEADAPRIGRVTVGTRPAFAG
jgi:hypothetical protein